MNKEVKTITEGFLDYLSEQGLSDLLPDIAQSLTHEAERRQMVTIMSAAELSTTEKDNLTTSVTAKWGEHPVTFTVDATLLSGIIVAFKDHILDMSGRNALTDLRETLA